MRRTLETGDLAPAVSFFDAAGHEHTLDSLLAGGPVLLAFFKVSCPVCQMTLPYLQRLAGGRLRIVPVSQDNAEATLGFSQAFSFELPSLFDREEDEYPASNAFHLTNVPSLFVVEPGRRIVWDSVGFVKRDLLVLGESDGKALFHSGDMVPELKAG
jgi:peroxiredoxin